MVQWRKVHLVIISCAVKVTWLVLGLQLFASHAFGQQVDWRSWPVRSYAPRNYDVLHYRIELRFDHPNRQFFGRTTVTLRPLVDDATSLTFDAEVFTIRSVTREPGHAVMFTQRPGEVIVSLDDKVERSDTLRLTFVYDGRQIEIDPDRWGVGNNYHLGLEFFDSTDAHPALISSLSFAEGARHFFPCNDHPSDKASQEMILEVPKDWKAASNGSLVDVRATSHGTSVWHWSLREPHSTYLSVIAAGPYVVLSDSLGPLSLKYWVYPQHVTDAHRTFSQTPQIMAFFERTYGVKYPWTKYDQILIPGIGGGAESTTATVLGQSTIHDERAEQDFPSHWLVAHEAAHQWWGDLVTFKDWGHTWINESFATYGEYLYSRWSLGDDEGMINLNDKREQYFREARTKYRRPIVMDRWKFPNDNFDSHTYPKGANVLHMLRAEIGDSAFFAFHRKVLTEHAFSNALTDDIRSAAEATSGRDLRRFFDQWLMKPGHPVMNVSWRWDAVASAARIRVDQVQDTSGSIPIYTFPAIVGIRSAGIHRTERILVQQKVDEFVVPCASKPDLIEFDEPHDLLAEVTFQRPASELIVQLEKGNALSRVLAANQLSAFVGDPVAVGALMTAARNDAFWAVRRAATAGLIGAVSGTGKDFFSEMLADKSSKVRATAVRGLGALNDASLVPMFKDQYRKDDSYAVQAEIVRAMGRLRMKELREFFLMAADVRSPRNIIRNAAVEGLRLLDGE
jgi:aminopeptidase N